MPVKDLYYQKYLKYKNKYLDLQSSIGGGPSPILILHDPVPLPPPLPLQTDTFKSEKKYEKLSEDLQNLILENVDGKLEIFNKVSQKRKKTIILQSLKKKLKLHESINIKDMFILNPDVSVYHPVYLTNFEIFELAKIFVENIDRIKTPSIKYMQIPPISEPTDIPISEPTDIPISEPTDIPISEPIDITVVEQPLLNGNTPVVFNLKELKTCILSSLTPLNLYFTNFTHPYNDVLSFELLFIFFCILLKNKQLQQLKTPLEINLSNIKLVNRNIFINIIFGLKMNIINKIIFFKILLVDSDIKILADALQANITLITFELIDITIGRLGVEALADALIKNKKITKFTLKRNLDNKRLIDEEGVELLAKALGSNETITTLNLSGNMIGPTGVKALADALTTNKETKITTLNLGSNMLKDEGVELLAKALETNETITKLNLVHNTIGPAGVKALVNALTKITTLDLGVNSLKDEGVKVLADALKTNTTITTFNLSDNTIGPQGVKALVDALTENKRTKITTLNLSYNKIGLQGVKVLADALKTNETITTITTLDLGGNQIGNYGATVLADALKTNKTITTLDLDDNQIGDDGGTVLANALKTNTTMRLLNLRKNSIYGNVYQHLKSLRLETKF
jgi:Ran GTPase-activating protein (RanGAP) involved in mRNA processing and transport